MAKGWSVVKTVNDVEVKPKTYAEKYRDNRSFQKTMAKTKTLSAEDLKKESAELYEIKVWQEENLVAAYNDKRIKSKNLAKKARKLIADKKKTSNKAATEEEQTAEV